MRQTTILNSIKIEKKKYILIDAKGLILGRLASKITIILQGKNKIIFTTHINCGNSVIIINAEKIKLSGNKLKNKIYYNHSLYPGGLKKTTAKNMLIKKPIYLIEHAVKGMLPKNKLGNKLFNNLFVYKGDKHPHEAQKPIKLELNNI